MKKQLVLIVTLSSLLMMACEEEPAYKSMPGGTSSGNVNPGSSQPLIDSFHPKSAKPGSTVVIFGQNFGPAVSDNDVRFDSTTAEIKEVHAGTLIVTVPMNLPQGSYIIHVSTRGANASAPDAFIVTNSAK
jgi:hypothetical protein